MKTALKRCLKFNRSPVFQVNELPDGARAEVPRAWQWICICVQSGLVAGCAAFTAYTMTGDRRVNPLIRPVALLALLLCNQVAGYLIFSRKLERLPQESRRRAPPRF